MILGSRDRNKNKEVLHMEFGDVAKGVAGATLRFGERGAKEAMKFGQAGYDKIEETVERVKENKLLQEETKQLVENTEHCWQDAVSRLDVATEDAKQALEELEQQRKQVVEYQGARFQRLYKYALMEASSEKEFSIPNSDRRIIDEKIASQVVYDGQVDATLGGMAVGAASVVTTAGATAFLGTAGTGAAIGGLHGAAAINATLAALGGGTLAGGGFGIAGGMAVLGGLLIIPGLAVGGYVWDKNVRESYQKAQTYAEKTKVSVSKLKGITNNYKVAVKRIRATIYETTTLNGFLDGLLNVFESDLVIGMNNGSRSICEDAVRVSQRLLNLNFVTENQIENTNVAKDLRIIHDDLDRVKHGFGIYLSGLNEQYRKEAKQQVDIALEKFHENLEKPYVVKALENQELRQCLLETFNWAKKEICIITPWITSWVVDTFMIERMRRSMERNVSIRIVYGIGDISSTPKNKNACNDRNKKTEDMAERLRRIFVQYGDRFRMQRQNTHAKLLTCDDRYYVIGSYNFLSFDGDYSKADVRAEIGDYSENKDLLAVYKSRHFNF